MLQSLDIEKIIPSSPRPALRLQVFLINGVKIRSPPPSPVPPPPPPPPPPPHTHPTSKMCPFINMAPKC